MAGPLVLNDAVGSPCARRIRIVPLEKGLRWATRALDLTRLEQKRPEYRVISESNLITVWPSR